jgi:hypothetical protein
MARGKYLLIIPGRLSPPRPVSDFAEASAIYSQLRDESDEGASTWPTGLINNYGMNVAHISYNGRVWEPGPWEPGDKPIYDPFDQQAEAA